MLLVVQSVPVALSLPATHWGVPDAQSMVPAFLQEFVGVQAPPWLQVTQLPPTQTDPDPHVVMSVTLVQVPVEQVWHAPQAVWQHTPDTQLLFLHWLLALGVQA